MNQRPSREETLFFAAAEMATPEMRAGFLDRECAGDAALRQRVEALLKSAGDSNQPFMSSPALPEGPAGTVIVPVTEKAGDKIGRYKLLQQIGEGGCGVVYMAEQSEPVLPSPAVLTDAAATPGVAVARLTTSAPHSTGAFQPGLCAALT